MLIMHVVLLGQALVPEHINESCSQYLLIAGVGHVHAAYMLEGSVNGHLRWHHRIVGQKILTA